MADQIKNYYTIIFEGYLDQRHAYWFNGMQMSQLAGGLTRLEGSVKDQSALHGMLNRIRDMRLPLLLVVRGDYDNHLQMAGSGVSQ